MANGVGWRAPRVDREDNHSKAASAHVLRVWSAGSPRGEARAGRTARESNTVIKTSRRPCCQPVKVLVRSSPGRRRGEKRAPRWPTTQPRQVCQRARAQWAVGRFSTGRKVRGMRATAFERNNQDLSNVVPLTCFSVCAVEPQPTAWGGACSALSRNTTTPSPRCSARAPWAVGRFSTGKKARGTRATGFDRGGQDLSKTMPPNADLSQC